MLKNEIADTERIFWRVQGGSLEPVTEPCISPLDRGFLYGDGLFETIRCRGNTPLWLDRHLARLQNGADVLGVDIDARFVGLKAAEAVEKSRFLDARLRITITRGEMGSDWRSLSSPSGPNIIIELSNLNPRKPLPVTLTTVLIRRDEKSPLSQVKSLNYLPSILAAAEARKNGFDDGLLLNTIGEVAEASSSNIFAVFGNRMVTPPVECGALPGITREIILEISQKRGLEVIEKGVLAEELKDADEVFLTNSIKGVIPVRRIDDTNYAKSSFTLDLAQAYELEIERAAS